METMVKRSGKTFAGMVFPDTHPVTVPDRYVRQVHMFDIPAGLREHAAYSLNSLSGGEWWTVGEFRYEGEDFDTAVARRVLRGSRMVVEYGVESEGE